MQVSPDVMEEHASAVDAAVAALRYGSVNINVASMLGFCVPRLTWGAFPGNPITVRPCPGRHAVVLACNHRLMVAWAVLGFLLSCKWQQKSGPPKSWPKQRPCFRMAVCSFLFEHREWCVS